MKIKNNWIFYNSISSQHLLIQLKQWKHQSNMWNYVVLVSLFSALNIFCTLLRAVERGATGGPPSSIKLQDIFIFPIWHRIPPIPICVFIGAIQQVRHLGRRVDKASNKNEIEGIQKCDISHKNSSMHLFFCNSIFVPSWFLRKPW